jgi:hypothetical protein
MYFPIAQCYDSGVKLKCIPFWTRYKMRSNGCWEWVGALDGKGYGIFRNGITGKLVHAHRHAYLLTHGGIPKRSDPRDASVCHKCDNRLCIRPDHLFLATHSQNLKDAAAKGRMKNLFGRGERHFKAVLTKAQVRSIRRQWDKRTSAQPVTRWWTRMAERYGVSVRCIRSVVDRESWPGVEP